MTTMLEEARALLALRRFALVGVSRDPKDFSRTILKALLERGYDVVPVNPAAAGAAVEGRPLVASLGAISPPVEAAIFMTPPARTAGAVREALAAGVRRLWFHQGSGAGAASEEALALCRAAGVAPVIGLCPFMALADAGWFHRLHAFLRRSDAARPVTRG
jgi:predicted CoA-binding protein